MLFEGAYMKKFAAGIVSYNPDISRLKENIETIRKQVKIVLIIDNASDNVFSTE